MSDPRFPVIILGASARAAAWSAIRAGYQPICLDLFADIDLQEVASVQKIQPYPFGLIEALESIPECPVMYTGGLENHPEVIEAAARLHQLFGNEPEINQRVRHPDQLAQGLRLLRDGVPEWRDAEHAPEPDGTWLLKPLHGTGGKGITVWNSAAGQSETLRGPHGFQKRVAGRSYSALFLADREIGDVQFVGITEQLIGEEVAGAGPFMWCGNIGPVSLPISIEVMVRRAANLLKSGCKIKGLFGIDFVVDDNDVPWIIEVNPRYTASTELLEFATGQCLIQHHMRCFDGQIPLPRSTWQPPASAPALGKMVLFAPHNFAVQEMFTVDKQAPYRFPSLADLPAVTTPILAGQPVCTVYASGQTLEDCRSRLIEKVQQLKTRLFSGDSK